MEQQYPSIFLPPRQNEAARRLRRLLGLPEEEEQPSPAAEAAARLRQALGLDEEEREPPAPGTPGFRRILADVGRQAVLGATEGVANVLLPVLKLADRPPGVPSGLGPSGILLLPALKLGNKLGNKLLAVEPERSPLEVAEAARDAVREWAGPPETAAGTVAGLGAGLATLALPYIGAARLAAPALEAAHLAAAVRAAQGSRLAGTAAGALRPLVNPASRYGRAFADFVLGAPVTAGLAQAGPEYSVAGAIAALTQESHPEVAATAQEIAEDPVKRTAAELLADLTGVSALYSLGQIARSTGRLATGRTEFQRARAERRAGRAAAPSLPGPAADIPPPVVARQEEGGAGQEAPRAEPDREEAAAEEAIRLAEALVRERAGSRAVGSPQSPIRFENGLVGYRDETGRWYLRNQGGEYYESTLGPLNDVLDRLVDAGQVRAAPAEAAPAPQAPRPARRPSLKLGSRKEPITLPDGRAGYRTAKGTWFLRGGDGKWEMVRDRGRARDLDALVEQQAQAPAVPTTPPPAAPAPRTRRRAAQPAPARPEGVSGSPARAFEEHAQAITSARTPDELNAAALAVQADESLTDAQVGQLERLFNERLRALSQQAQQAQPAPEPTPPPGPPPPPPPAQAPAPAPAPKRGRARARAAPQQEPVSPPQAVPAAPGEIGVGSRVRKRGSTVIRGQVIEEVEAPDGRAFKVRTDRGQTLLYRPEELEPEAAAAAPSPPQEPPAAPAAPATPAAEPPAAPAPAPTTAPTRYVPPTRPATGSLAPVRLADGRLVYRSAKGTWFVDTEQGWKPVRDPAQIADIEELARGAAAAQRGEGAVTAPQPETPPPQAPPPRAAPPPSRPAPRSTTGRPWHEVARERFEQMGLEGVPDEEYKAFLTPEQTRVPLRSGETWRQRAEARIEQERQRAAGPAIAGQASLFGRRRGGEEEPLEEGTVGVTYHPSTAEKLGENFYRQGLPLVALKEALQNSIDAVRANGGVGEIRVSIDTAGRTLRVEDTGAGMSPDVAKQVFTAIGASAGKTADATGGYGFAKVALFAGAEHMQVTTVARDPRLGLVRTEMSGSGEDWLNGTFRYAVYRETDPNAQTGTRLFIEFGQEHRFDSYRLRDFAQSALGFKRVGTPIEIRIDGDLVTPTSRGLFPGTYSAGPTAETEGARYETLVSNRRVPGAIRYHVLNNGYYQFTKNWYPPSGMYNLPLPEVVVDIKPKVEPGKRGYPFIAAREELVEGAEAEISEIMKRIVADAMAARAKDAQLLLTSAPKIRGSNMLRVYPHSLDAAVMDLAREIADEPYMAQYAQALHLAFSELADMVSSAPPGSITFGYTPGAYFPWPQFGGVSLDKRWLGVNIDRTLIAGQLRPGEAALNQNMVLANPFGAIHELRERIAQVPAKFRDPYWDEARILAYENLGTLLHELLHQIDRQHGTAFAGLLTRYMGLLTDPRVAPHLRRLEDAWRSMAGNPRFEEHLRRVVEVWERRGLDNILEDYSVGARTAGDVPGLPSGRGPEERPGLAAPGDPLGPGGRAAGPGGLRGYPDVGGPSSVRGAAEGGGLGERGASPLGVVSALGRGVAGAAAGGAAGAGVAPEDRRRTGALSGAVAGFLLAAGANGRIVREAYDRIARLRALGGEPPLQVGTSLDRLRRSSPRLAAESEALRKRLPRYVYHVTPYLPEIRQSGRILMSNEFATPEDLAKYTYAPHRGLGGGAVPGVSLTTSWESAKNIARELLRIAEIVQGGFTREQFDAKIRQWMDADLGGLGLADAEKARLLSDIDRVYRFAKTTEGASEGEAQFEAFRWYLRRRDNIPGAPRDPLFMGDYDDYVGLRTANAGIIAIPRDQLPENVWVLQGSDVWQDEIRVAGDISTRRAEFIPFHYLDPEYRPDDLSLVDRLKLFTRLHRLSREGGFADFSRRGLERFSDEELLEMRRRMEQAREWDVVETINSELARRRVGRVPREEPPAPTRPEPERPPESLSLRWDLFRPGEHPALDRLREWALGIESARPDTPTVEELNELALLYYQSDTQRRDELRRIVDRVSRDLAGRTGDRAHDLWGAALLDTFDDIDAGTYQPDPLGLPRDVEEFLAVGLEPEWLVQQSGGRLLDREQAARRLDRALSMIRERIDGSRYQGGPFEDEERVAESLWRDFAVADDEARDHYRGVLDDLVQRAERLEDRRLADQLKRVRDEIDDNWNKLGAVAPIAPALMQVGGGALGALEQGQDQEEGGVHRAGAGLLIGLGLLGAVMAGPGAKRGARRLARALHPNVPGAESRVATAVAGVKALVRDMVGSQFTQYGAPPAAAHWFEAHPGWRMGDRSIASMIWLLGRQPLARASRETFELIRQTMQPLVTTAPEKLNVALRDLARGRSPFKTLRERKESLARIQRAVESVAGIDMDGNILYGALDRQAMIQRYGPGLGRGRRENLELASELAAEPLEPIWAKSSDGSITYDPETSRKLWDELSDLERQIALRVIAPEHAAYKIRADQVMGVIKQRRERLKELLDKYKSLNKSRAFPGRQLAERARVLKAQLMQEAEALHNNIDQWVWLMDRLNEARERGIVQAATVAELPSLDPISRETMRVLKAEIDQNIEGWMHHRGFKNKGQLLGFIRRLRRVRAATSRHRKGSPQWEEDVARSMYDALLGLKEEEIRNRMNEFLELAVTVDPALFERGRVPAGYAEYTMQFGRNAGKKAYIRRRVYEEWAQELKRMSQVSVPSEAAEDVAQVIREYVDAATRYWTMNQLVAPQSVINNVSGLLLVFMRAMREMALVGLDPRNAAKHFYRFLRYPAAAIQALPQFMADALPVSTGAVTRSRKPVRIEGAPFGARTLPAASAGALTGFLFGPWMGADDRTEGALFGAAVGAGLGQLGRIPTVRGLGPEEFGEAFFEQYSKGREAPPGLRLLTKGVEAALTAFHAADVYAKRVVAQVARLDAAEDVADELIRRGDLPKEERSFYIAKLAGLNYPAAYTRRVDAEALVNRLRAQLKDVDRALGARNISKEEKAFLEVQAKALKESLAQAQADLRVAERDEEAVFRVGDYDLRQRSFYAPDYALAPGWLNNFQRSALGQMVSPFLKWGYFYGRTLYHHLIRPILDEQTPVRERLADFLAFMALTAPAYVWMSESAEESDAPVVSKEEAQRGLSYRYDRSGRGNLSILPVVGPALHESLGLDPGYHELHLRAIKYPFFDIGLGASAALRGDFESLRQAALEKFSPGFGLQVAATLAGWRNKYNMFQEPEAILGEQFRSWVPMHRLFEDVGRYSWPVAHRPETFVQGLTGEVLRPFLGYEGARLGLYGPIRLDRDTGEPIFYNPDLALLQGTFGLNIRDVPRPLARYASRKTDFLLDLAEQREGFEDRVIEPFYSRAARSRLRASVQRRERERDRLRALREGGSP